MRQALSHQSNAHPRKTRFFVALAAISVALLTYAAFRPAIDGEFLNWDDDRNIVDNPSFRGLAPEQMSWAWRTYHLGVWQPLAWMLLGAQYEARRLDASAYHAVSVVLHAINAAVFFLMSLVLLRAAQSRRDAESRQSALPNDHRAPGETGITHPTWLTASLATLLFAIHPLRVEPVAWVSCQPYLPAALFFMLGVTIYVFGYRSDAKPRARVATLMLTLLCYIAAVLFKAAAVTLPLVLLIVDVYPLRRIHVLRGLDARRWLAAVGEKLPFFVVAGVVAMHALAAKDYNESRVPFNDWSASERLAHSAYGIIFYAWKSIAPTHLTAYYQLPPDISLTAAPYGWLAMAAASVTIVALAAARRTPGFAASWIAYLIILAPSLGLVQISRQIAADRYAYLATMPLYVMLAALIARWVQRSKPRRAAVLFLFAAAVVAWQAVSMRGYLADWRDSESLWRASIARDPGCAHSHCQLGQALAVQAQKQPRRRDDLLSDAAAHFREAVRIDADFAFAYSNLGAVLLVSQRFEEARGAYEAALQRASMFSGDELARLHAGLALVLANLGDIQAAREHLHEAERHGLPPEQVQRILSVL